MFQNGLDYGMTLAVTPRRQSLSIGRLHLQRTTDQFDRVWSAWSLGCRLPLFDSNALSHRLALHRPRGLARKIITRATIAATVIRISSSYPKSLIDQLLLLIRGHS